MAEYVSADVNLHSAIAGAIGDAVSNPTQSRSAKFSEALRARGYMVVPVLEHKVDPPHKLTPKRMTCRHCGLPIVGSKGDYWHGDYDGPMRCADGEHLADPLQFTPDPLSRGAESVVEHAHVGDGPSAPISIPDRRPGEDEALADYRRLVRAEAMAKAVAGVWLEHRGNGRTITAARLREHIEYWWYGHDSVIPPAWEQYEERLDPDWAEYKRLKNKFEGSE